jgi:alkyl sulfatase BDS1-like metallo-beta-lactamase superfamily hydrolase
VADLLALSSRYIDEDLYEGPGSVNRVTTDLSELADGIAMIEAFSHVGVLRSEAGLVLFDTSLEPFAAPVLASLRRYSDAPVHSIVYTHGHIDHVGGTAAMLEEAASRGDPRPRLVGHRNVQARFDRYERTNGYNRIINERQFGPGKLLADGKPARFGPSTFVGVDTAFEERLELRVGELTLQLHHDRGETDDHLWAFVPDRRVLLTGDFVMWVFPNAGNPQKVQRYPAEWAQALRKMAACEPELLIPAHGLPIGGKARIARVLDEMASALESIVTQTLKLMNEGATLDTVLHTVELPEVTLARPFLRPTYDEPEFTVRNVWRLYGGWYDGNPARLKPAPDAALATEVAALAGGANKLAERALELAQRDELRLACHLIELATQAAPDDAHCHALRAEIYTRRREAESSLMAKGIFGAAARDSKARAE